ncbi:glycosyltransferase [Oceanobacillus profundus]|uniref:glycosyltransferase n=1 Tax=Oceanobacillus profundus TaxID=372463 RepID=UPI00203FE0FA|nr:glycosyltransferase [Oceanobacillus profundus]MCM3399455.1 glycosyltransferase [Oceanobacillus profundus]
MSDSLISVVIPVYNVEDYIDECIKSVLNQTYKNVEIIVINDGSTDNSLKILENYAFKNDNIILISQKNSGQSVARNKGIEVASGEYIYFLDSDDFILPETLDHLILTMEQNNLDLVRFRAESFVDKIDMQVNYKKYDFNKFFDSNKVYNKEEFLKLNLVTFSSSPVLYMVKKDLLINNNILFKPGIIHEDDLFTLEVFINTNLMMYKSNAYYKRRYRPNSTMTTESIVGRKKSFDSRCVIVNELNGLLEKYTGKLEVKLINKRIHTLIAILMYSYQELDKNYKKRHIKGLKNLSAIDYYYYYLRREVIKYLSPIKKILTK